MLGKKLGETHRLLGALLRETRNIQVFRIVIDVNPDRVPYIDQAQSFVPNLCVASESGYAGVEEYYLRAVAMYHAHRTLPRVARTVC